MPARIVSGLMCRELKTLADEVSAYPDEADLWKEIPGVGNTAGNLALHLVGNLNHFVGAVFGETGYVRNRDAEFSLKNVPREEILDQIGGTISVIQKVLAGATNERLAAPFPMTLAGNTIASADFLAHLCSHLSYHLGQVDYHRRIVTGQAGEIHALPMSELATAKPAAG